MDFSLSSEHQILRESVRSFAENEIQPAARELDEKEEFSYETMRKMAELGLFGVFVSDLYGGQAMDYLSYIIAVEEIARVDGSHAATVAAENSLGIGPLYYFGNEEQKKKYLPQLCKGEALWGFGLTEPNAGSDASNSKTNAVLDGNEWVINAARSLSPTPPPGSPPALRYWRAPACGMTGNPSFPASSSKPAPPDSRPSRCTAK